jgi:hypothetical protein
VAVLHFTKYKFNLDDEDEQEEQMFQDEGSFQQINPKTAPILEEEQMSDAQDLQEIISGE